MDPILDDKELAKNWEEVRDKEMGAIRLRRQQAGIGKPDDVAAGNPEPPHDLVGLALSGGGIRSACFNLGFLQALTQCNLTRYVDYLSTVSGGGYIGSFFSALAHRRWRERELAKQPQHVAESDAPLPATAAPLPLNPDPTTHQQPVDVKNLIGRSSYINDMPGFFNRYLVGTLLLNLTFFSGALFAAALVAYAWRLMDEQEIARYFIWYSDGVLGESLRPFVPALVILLFLWLPSWLYSFWRHGTGAPARHSGIYLVAMLVSLVVGLAIWLGTPNMNVTNVLRETYRVKGARSLNWHNDLVYPLAVLVTLCLVPFLRPGELLKSGQQRDKPWKGALFNAAGIGLLVGVPFFMVYVLGKHNLSGVADRWDRNLVSSDVLDWENMLLALTNEKGPEDSEGLLRPGYALTKFIEENNVDLFKEISNVVKAVKLNRQVLGNPAEYLAAEQLKDSIAAMMNRAIGEFKFSYYILKSHHADTTEKTEKAMEKWDKTIETALKDHAWLVDNETHPQRKQILELEHQQISELLDSFSSRMNNGRMREKLGLQLREYVKDERIRNKLAAGDVERVRDKLKEIDDAYLKDRNASKAEEEQANLDIARLLEENKTLLEKIDADRKKLESLSIDAAARERNKAEIAVMQQRVNDNLKQIDTNQRKIVSLNGTLNRIQGELELRWPNKAMLKREKVFEEHLKDDWFTVFFPTGIQPRAAGHLLLRLFYPDTFREIQFVSRPLVIAEDQRVRGWLLLSALLFFLACGYLIDFNYTSLHGYYQSRLMRAFMVRYPPLDESDEHRDVPLAALKNVEEGQPYHILSGTTEVLVGRRRESRLTAFQFTQQYCGALELGFAKTAEYCDGRVSLADAMSISGAAINPMRVDNLLVKILLVVTNFRLGQWLPHPVRGPRRCFVPFFRIASALFHQRPTNEEQFVFAADGGFYDNLGIDILLERRCRLIVSSDAGADEQIQLADCANLYRLCRDKGIRLVQLHEDSLLTMECVLEAVKERNFTICRILYPDGSDGLLFYMKSFLVPPATLDLAQYQTTHAQFPHDATTNQFFDETQFKSYQQLGWQIGTKLCEWLFPEEWKNRPIAVDRLKDMIAQKVKKKK